MPAPVLQLELAASTSISSGIVWLFDEDDVRLDAALLMPRDPSARERRKKSISIQVS